MTDIVNCAVDDCHKRELMAEIERLRAVNAELREALTPSGKTKAAYIGEFSFSRETTDGKFVETIVVPWTTIKEIMAAILARAAKEPKGTET